jgi:hypothetical protein
MENEILGQAELFSLIVGVIGLVVGIVGICFAVYQTAVINETKKQRVRLQYLLAGVSNLALSKAQAWINQSSLMAQADTSSNLDIARVIIRAKDDFTEVHSLAAALEKSIDCDGSAITELLKETLIQSELNNKIQAEALKNPSVKPPSNDH